MIVTIRLTDPQASALECRGLELRDCNDERQALLDRCWDRERQRLVFPKDEADSLGFAINDESNAEDDAARHESDIDMRKHAARAARVLSNLAGKVFRSA